MEMNENGALQQQVYLAITYIFAPKVGATSKSMSSQFLPGALNGTKVVPILAHQKGTSCLVCGVSKTSP